MPRSSQISIQTRARNDLDPSLYPLVDAFLKFLKATSRRLQVASTTSANEEQLLQRLYYKGKNQHRSALFWRRTTELCRYSGCAKQLNLPDLVLRLRSSFFGEEAFSNQSLLKGAWNHCPEPKSLDVMLLQVAEARALFAKFQERTMGAYSLFTVSMQSGAFIQILLVLAAISARMNAIAQEYLVILDGLSLSMQDLKRALMACFSQRNPPTLTKVPYIESPIEENPPQPSGSHTAIDKGASATANRQQPNTIVARATPPLGGMRGHPDAGQHKKFRESYKASTPALFSSSKFKSTIETASQNPKLKPSNNTKRPSKDKEKKKRKKDEIDDIFGF